MKILTMWQVYRKGNTFRIGKETRGGLDFYMLSEEEPSVFWETLDKIIAINKARELNTPKPIMKWELVDE